MGTMLEVGQRIRSRMPHGMSQRRLAERVGMTPDALSRALSGQRGLSSIEVARLAETLNADTHWLITGSPDPFRVQVAARHAWDPVHRTRTNVGKELDQTTLDQVVDLYRVAFAHGPTTTTDLPQDPDAIRGLLGPGFVRSFADALERHLAIDVVRLPGLSTDYSLRIGQRGVIVLATMSSWFRSNWSLAHELGHLALGHHNDYDSPKLNDSHELAANKFASRLLISDEDLDRLASAKSESDIARVVWDLGVSTEALRYRLDQAQHVASPVLGVALQERTQRLIRKNLDAIGEEDPLIDPIAMREQSASARRFPFTLLSSLQQQTELGSASPVHLAWALDVPVDDLDFPAPDEDAESAAYKAMLSARPALSDWQNLIARTDD